MKDTTLLFSLVTPAGSRNYERLNIAALAFIGTFVVVAFFKSVLADPDTWWHLASGRLIVSDYSIPATDPFSHSRYGSAWHAHEWATEILMWGSYAVGGWVGLIALTAASAGAASAILAYFVRPHLSPAATILVAFVTLICLLPSAWARPHLLVLPLFVTWVGCLLRASEEQRAPPIWLAVIMVVWANMHGSFLLGILFMGALGLEAVATSQDRRRTMLAWGLFGMAMVLASLMTPFGISGYTYPLYVSSMTSLEGIGEWANSSLKNSRVFIGVLLASLAALLMLGARFPPVRAAIFTALLYLAFKHIRHQFVFAYIGALLAAEPIGRALKKKSEAPSSSAIDRPLFFGLVFLAVGAVSIRLLVPADVNKGSALPIKAISKIPAEISRLPVFNHYDFGGPLIFHGISPFIDGRADMYGDKFFDQYTAAANGDRAAWQRIEREYRIEWVILPPGAPLIAKLRQDHWRQIYADDKAVIQVKPKAM